MSTSAAAGRPVLGRYQLGPALGRGATAVVRRARDLVTGDDVAVKAIPVELGLAPRVRAEVRAAGRLRHPSVVALRDWGEDRECLYLVWELVEGPSLAEVLRRPERPGDRAMVRAAEDVLGALAHAHQRGVVHRDVKPANILLDPAGRARLSDFGIARLSGEAGLTLTGGIVGTVAYMAPEQALGLGAEAPADVYAACLVLHECLTGANPIAASSPAETARRAAAGAVPPLAAVRPDLPERLCRAVDAGLRRVPEQRPSAAALAEVLAEARGGISAARRRGARALPRLASAAGGAALAAVGAAEAADVLAGAGTGAWRGPLVVGAVAAAAALFAWAPRAGALLAVVGGAALVGAGAPGAGAVLGALALLVLALGWRTGRLTLLPAAAPVLFALGLGPLYAVAAGLAPRWPARLWAGAAGVVAALGWGAAAGGELLAGAGHAEPGLDGLAGEASPVLAAQRLWEPLAAHPEALVQGAVLAALALCAPLVARARADAPRIAAAAAWSTAMLVLLAAVAPSPERAIGATAPAALVVLAWALRPWRALRGRVPARTSATLRSPIA